MDHAHIYLAPKCVWIYTSYNYELREQKFPHVLVLIAEWTIHCSTWMVGFVFIDLFAIYFCICSDAHILLSVSLIFLRFSFFFSKLRLIQQRLIDMFRTKWFADETFTSFLFIDNKILWCAVQYILLSEPNKLQQTKPHTNIRNVDELPSIFAVFFSFCFLVLTFDFVRMRRFLFSMWNENGVTNNNA